MTDFASQKPATVKDRLTAFARDYLAMLRAVGLRLQRTFAPAPAPYVPPRPVWRDPVNVTAVAISVIVALVIFADEAAFGWASSQTDRMQHLFLRFAEAGKADWMLIGSGLMALGALAAMTRFHRFKVRAALADIAGRAAFVFAGVAVPGIAVAIIKQVVGRARPLVEGEGHLAFNPWSGYYYASFPSGDACNGAAFAMAMGFLFPKYRIALWAFALWVAFGRVITERHFPSDVIGGILIAIVGVLLVRAWFARRRIVFAETSGGIVTRHRPRLAGLAWAGGKRVAQRIFRRGRTA